MMRRLDPIKVGSVQRAVRLDASIQEGGSQLGQALHQGHSRSSWSMSGCPMCFTSSTRCQIGIEPVSQWQAAVRHPALSLLLAILSLLLPLAILSLLLLLALSLSWHCCCC